MSFLWLLIGLLPYSESLASPKNGLSKELLRLSDKSCEFLCITKGISKGSPATSWARPSISRCDLGISSCVEALDFLGLPTAS